MIDIVEYVARALVAANGDDPDVDILCAPSDGEHTLYFDDAKPRWMFSTNQAKTVIEALAAYNKTRSDILNTAFNNSTVIDGDGVSLGNCPHPRPDDIWSYVIQWVVAREACLLDAAGYETSLRLRRAEAALHARAEVATGNNYGDGLPGSLTAQLLYEARAELARLRAHE